MILTPGRILDACCTALDLEHGAAVQLHRAPALLAAAASLRGQGGPDAEVRSYAETQGLGAYAPPPAPFPLLPAAPAIIWDVGADAPAGRLYELLIWRYPQDHPVTLLALDESGAATHITRLALADLATLNTQHSPLNTLHLPSLVIAADLRGPEGLHWVVARLLAPGGCPWDVRQTHQSLRGALLEEAYEVLEALDADDAHGLSEELGDLLISIFAHSEMARQAGAFSVADVFGQVAGKLIRRHPHVFGDVAVEGVAQVHQSWEQIKAAELAEKGRSRPSALDGVPPALPALAVAQKLGKKAARAGFAWPDADGAWAKLREELAELEAAVDSGDAAHTAEELGDLLLITARLASYLGVDAEAALREANAKFRRRFTSIERGRNLSDLSLDEMIALWEEAKGAV
ncbi:nucleoside triphosphate pyrophosphohydrolase [Oscillochloris sp. ZM17-4]|uniref:nucleoside triphosphate pyrophosphohydrolase n=1 Tax=Oscillochloris sp. ZM17-4 TaxID=2866714 RepID=UPI001C72C442|nr:nucleoside triphosphate pyrophosphohydrolase [Oscillochloris sp. ZM17-4]MBX0328894.1 nucleoside triphosphate pyrophosphohydrolase [Oscillochloris sp. ZM17-4]